MNPIFRFFRLKFIFVPSRRPVVVRFAILSGYWVPPLPSLFFRSPSSHRYFGERQGSGDPTPCGGYPGPPCSALNHKV